MKKIAVVLFLVSFFTTCSGEDKTPATSPSPGDWIKVIKSTKPNDLVDKILPIKNGTLLSFNDIIDEISNDSVIFVGETHDQLPQHQVQDKVFRVLYDKDKNVVLGMEMFQRPYQKQLDEYIAGNISESEMLSKTNYFERWGFRWKYYQPMVKFAKENKLKVVALNVPTEISRKVGRSGLASLNEEEKKLIPEEIDTANEQHKEYIRSIFENMGQHKAMMKFKNFYEGQCLWEDGMADSIARYFKDEPKSRMVVCVGSGHIIYKFGIPERMAKRTKLSYKTIITVSVDGLESFIKECEINNLPPADYFWFTKGYHEVKRVMLGVTLVPANDGGLGISGIEPGSRAEKAKLQVGDIITKAEGHSITNSIDLRLILEDKNEGDEIEMTIVRDKEEQKVKIKL